MEYIEKYDLLKNFGNLATHLSYSKTIFFQNVFITHDGMYMFFYAKVLKNTIINNIDVNMVKIPFLQKSYFQKSLKLFR